MADGLCKYCGATEAGWFRKFDMTEEAEQICCNCFKAAMDSILPIP